MKYLISLQSTLFFEKQNAIVWLKNTGKALKTIKTLINNKMQLPFFFEAELNTSQAVFTLSEETSKHCIQVLRMHKGEQLHLTNGKGILAKAMVQEAHKKNTVVTIEDIQTFEAPAKKISVGISLLKNSSRLEWFLEKATEVGVTDIIPLVCKRTERQHFRLERMNAILIAAMLQSEQTWLPVLHEPINFDKAINLNYHHTKLIAHCYPGTKPSITGFNHEPSVRIFIGPEGDFTEEEIAEALAHHFQPVHLGNHRLRTETAGITAAILLNQF